MASLRNKNGWFQLDISEHIDLMRPGVYEWRIGDQFIYIGKSSRLIGRLDEYPNNVRKMLGPVDKLDSQGRQDVIQGSFCGGYRGAVADGGCRVGVL